MDSFSENLLGSFFVLAILLFSPTHIEARGTFFSKFTHHTVLKEVEGFKTISPLEAPSPTPLPASSPSPVLAPAPAPIDGSGVTENFYGLYGHETGLFSPEKETPTTTTTSIPAAASTTTIPATTKDENELLNEELDRETDEKTDQGNTFSNINNGHQLTGSSFETGHGIINNNNGYTTSYNQYGEPTERKGMSDTRFVEGGKYYYDVKKENNNLYPSNNNNGYQLTGKSYETGNQKHNENSFLTGYYNNNNNGYTTTTTTSNVDNSHRLFGESYETGNRNNENDLQSGYYNNNNGYTTTNNNGYKLSAAENYKTSNLENKNNGYTSSSRYNNYGAFEQQGMSDTRFMEGGKYYVDVKNENQFPVVSTEGQGYNENAEKENEFGAMEDLQNQEQYKENQNWFFP